VKTEGRTLSTHRILEMTLKSGALSVKATSRSSTARPQEKAGNQSVIASEAKQSTATKEEWIASSLRSSQ
jgi:hypothetical protein